LQGQTLAVAHFQLKKPNNEEALEWRNSITQVKPCERVKSSDILPRAKTQGTASLQNNSNQSIFQHLHIWKYGKRK
jgi:hypothetical protein